MASLTDYFERIAYKPVYFLGDRVSGKWNKIPFIATVGNDRVVSEEGPEVVVHLDLPLLYNGKVHNILLVKHKDIKPLKKFD
jgi:hypothetical protein